MATPAAEPVLAPAVVPLAAGALPCPPHAESSEAPPVAAAKRRNVRRPGACLSWSPPSSIVGPPFAFVTLPV
jgi:hypothetical protein